MSSNVTYVKRIPVQMKMVNGEQKFSSKCLCSMTGTSADRAGMLSAELAQLADGSDFLETDTFEVYIFNETTQGWTS